jgi:hypothetical protein
MDGQKTNTHKQKVPKETKKSKLEVTCRSGMYHGFVSFHLGGAGSSLALARLFGSTIPTDHMHAWWHIILASVDWSVKQKCSIRWMKPTEHCNSKSKQFSFGLNKMVVVLVCAYLYAYIWALARNRNQGVRNECGMNVWSSSKILSMCECECLCAWIYSVWFEKRIHSR